MSDDRWRFGDHGDLRHIFVLLALTIVIYSFLGWLIIDGWILR